MRASRAQVWSLLCLAVAVTLASAGCADQDAGLANEGRASQFVDALMDGDNERIMTMGSVSTSDATEVRSEIEAALGDRIVSTDTGEGQTTHGGRETVEVVLTNADGESATVTVVMVTGTGKVDSVAADTE